MQFRSASTLKFPACFKCGKEFLRTAGRPRGRQCDVCLNKLEDEHNRTRGLRARYFYEPTSHPRVCIGCGEQKPAEDFTPKRSVTGGRSRYCRPCSLARRDTSKLAASRARSRAAEKRKCQALAAERRPAREAEAAARRAKKIADREAARRVAAERRAQERAKITTEKPWLALGLDLAERRRLRRTHDPVFALKERMRVQGRKRHQLRNLEYSVRKALIQGGTAYEKRLGYTIAELKVHLEARFVEGMSWKAFGEGRIHIDHIRPVASFDLDDPEQVRAAWSLGNLQPMWARDNLKKGAKYRGQESREDKASGIAAGIGGGDRQNPRHFGASYSAA